MFLKQTHQRSSLCILKFFSYFQKLKREAILRPPANRSHRLLERNKLNSVLPSRKNGLHGRGSSLKYLYVRSGGTVGIKKASKFEVMVAVPCIVRLSPMNLLDFSCGTFMR